MTCYNSLLKKNYFVLFEKKDYRDTSSVHQFIPQIAEPAKVGPRSGQGRAVVKPAAKSSSQECRGPSTRVVFPCLPRHLVGCWIETQQPGVESIRVWSVVISGRTYRIVPQSWPNNVLPNYNVNHFLFESWHAPCSILEEFRPESPPPMYNNCNNSAIMEKKLGKRSKPEGESFCCISEIAHLQSIYPKFTCASLN